MQVKNPTGSFSLQSTGVGGLQVRAKELWINFECIVIILPPPFLRCRIVRWFAKDGKPITCYNG